MHGPQCRSYTLTTASEQDRCLIGRFVRIGTYPVITALHTRYCALDIGKVDLASTILTSAARVNDAFFESFCDVAVHDFYNLV
jgi:hypothetical protein